MNKLFGSITFKNRRFNSGSHFTWWLVKCFEGLEAAFELLFKLSFHSSHNYFITFYLHNQWMPLRRDSLKVCHYLQQVFSMMTLSFPIPQSARTCKVQGLGFHCVVRRRTFQVYVLKMFYTYTIFLHCQVEENTLFSSAVIWSILKLSIMCNTFLLPMLAMNLSLNNIPIFTSKLGCICGYYKCR